MSRPKVLLTRRIPSSASATLEASCDVDRNDGAQLSPDQLKARLKDKEGVVCLMTDAMTAEVMDAAPRLKVIANVAVGYNNIDVPAAQARGIVVTNTPDVLTEATADLAWALIMDITRRVTEGDRLIRRGAWKGWALDFMLGNELRGKTLGIIGFGRIGKPWPRAPCRSGCG
jgi:glyoxylate reductase